MVDNNDDDVNLDTYLLVNNDNDDSTCYDTQKLYKIKKKKLIAEAMMMVMIIIIYLPSISIHFTRHLLFSISQYSTVVLHDLPTV